MKVISILTVGATFNARHELYAHEMLCGKLFRR